MARRQYPFHLIEPRWQGRWEGEQTFRAWNPGETLPPSHPFAIRHGLQGRTVTPSDLPTKLYILDMFPYPSGAGLHVGHPEGYTATDILARYRRAAGFHVLHPMGWDAFGLPAEQYAIRTGQHPRKTTEANITTFKRQIRSLGFSYDWSREVDTTDPEYFRWTQWIFLRLYHSWFNPATSRAEPIEKLPYPSELSPAAGASDPDLEAKRRAFRDAHRLAYVTEAPVWWCEALGTVLANEEVIDGRSEIGNFPVTRRPMRQWMLRITTYAERLLADLDSIQWSDSLKEMQRNWIGRSEGAEIQFAVDFEESSHPGSDTSGRDGITVFTTRPDTLFGATYMVLAPEHRLIETWLENGLIPERYPDSVPDAWRSAGQNPRKVVIDYRAECARKSDLERTDLAKEKTGVFTGVYAINPATGQKIPIWIADYVLVSYGTGAIMAVPAHDTRDLAFATRFELPIVQVVEPPDKGEWRGFVDEGVAVNSAHRDFSLNGLPTREARRRMTEWLEARRLGRRTIQYKLRDWLFSRQRYWGEPFPIVWRTDSHGRTWHEALPEESLPVLPPALDDYKPTPDGLPPLARAQDWVALPDGAKRELNTMPQWAGSCWYYLRYLSPQGRDTFVEPEAERYWMGSEKGDSASSSAAQSKTRSTSPAAPGAPGVDLYVGGTEHAVLHLLYARFWHKVLFDLGYVTTSEPFYRLVNQGLILGEDGQKMSKARGNVVNPDQIVAEYGADSLRLFEMFMGPLQDTKPWSTKGVEGVYRFLGRVWRLCVDEDSETEFEQLLTVTKSDEQTPLLDRIRLSPTIRDITPTPEQLRALHACVKKVTEDLEALRFNTAISAMMVFVNEALTWTEKPRPILRTFVQLLAPFAPHLAEELWEALHRGTGEQPIPNLSYSPWPVFDTKYLVQDNMEIPVQINGKLREVIKVPAGASPAKIEAAARSAEKVQAILAGQTVRKVIVVPGKLVNFVIS